MDGTQAYIHLKNFSHNIRTLGELAGGRAMCLAVKADAYGHGAVPITREAIRLGIGHFGVARISEARELREAGIRADILLFSAAVPSGLEHIIELNIQPFITHREMLEALDRLAAEASPLKVHIKVDTGMGRIGFPPEEAVDAARFIDASPRLILEGIATHYPLSDNPEDTLAGRQQRRMHELAAQLEALNIRPSYYHSANSGGILFHADDGMDMVRPGISAYGYAPDEKFAGELERRGISLKPVMELRAPVSFVKEVREGTGISYGHIWHADEDSRIATVNCGYADGYPRIASGKTRVRVDGRDCPQVGRVCMDQFMIKTGPAGGEAGVRPGDPAVLFGPDGPETAASLAEAAGTIAYEITCGITKRVPRIYV